MTRRILLVLLLTFPSPLLAQSIQGVLREEGSNRPIEGAVVSLLDAAGDQRAGVLTDAAGRFDLTAPSPGVYRLRAERIGYQSTLSQPLTLGAGEALHHDLLASTQAIELAGVQVEVGEGSRCLVRPSEGAQAAALWNEARKALNAAAITQDQALVRFRVRSYQRRLDPRTLEVMGEDARVRVGYDYRPFESLPAEQLARVGYMWGAAAGERRYYAPDAHVLLSDAFLDTHCFRVETGGPEQPDLIGLAFEPVRTRWETDIEGVLWLDQRTAELRYVEFDYTRTGLTGAAANGGRVEYERLPGGAWIVRRWWIRAPLFGRGAGEIDTHVIAVREVGGEVDEVGVMQVAQRTARLSGTVHDSLTAGPLAGATVFLSGTSYTAVTDSAGRFVMDGVRQGVYSVGLMHPRLDSLGVVAPPRTVTLAPGGHATIELATPSLTTTLAAAGEDTDAAEVSPLDDPPVVLEGVTVSVLSGETLEERARVTSHRAVEGPEVREMQARGVRVVDVLRNRFPVEIKEFTPPTPGICVEGLRANPTILGANIQRSTGGSCDMIEVYVDDVRIGDPGIYLRGMTLDQVESMEFLSPLEAGIRAGLRGGSGVLMIYTRRK